MEGRIEKDTAGNQIFIAHSCEYCQMDSAGNHSYNCINKGIDDFQKRLSENQRSLDPEHIEILRTYFWDLI